MTTAVHSSSFQLILAIRVFFFFFFFVFFFLVFGFDRRNEVYTKNTDVKYTFVYMTNHIVM